MITKLIESKSKGFAINYLLNLDESIGQGSKYFPVAISDFMSSRSINYNIYLKVGDKFVLVTRTGQEFTEQRVAHFAKKGVDYIYLDADDFAKYTDMQFMIANHLSKRPMDVTRKTKLMNHLIQSVSQQIIFKNVDTNLMVNSRIAFESYAQLSLNNTQINTVFSHLSMSSPGLVEKSAVRAMICSMVISLWKWSTPKVQSRMIMSSLFCDISLKDYPVLSQKNLIDYTPEEKIIFEKHPMESYKILSQIHEIPEEVLIVALQHHENSAGLGFPQKLNRDKLHPFSKVVRCVDEFVELLYFQPENDRHIQRTLEHMHQVQSKLISNQVLKTLFMIFKVQLPKNLESLMLPDQTNRVV